MDDRISEHMEFDQRFQNSFYKMSPDDRVKIGLKLLNLVISTFRLRDAYTAHHHENVAALSVLIAEKTGYSEGRILGIQISAMLHDIGKIGVPMTILNKASKLYPHELETVKAHVMMGGDIFKGIDLPWPIYDVIMQHHERLDGSGYPYGLMADQIISEAKIVAVADVYDAMSSERPYRKGLGQKVAIDFIMDNRGTQFDPIACDAFYEIIKSSEFPIVNLKALFPRVDMD